MEEDGDWGCPTRSLLPIYKLEMVGTTSIPTGPMSLTELQFALSCVRWSRCRLCACLCGWKTDPY